MAPGKGFTMLYANACAFRWVKRRHLQPLLLIVNLSKRRKKGASRTNTIGHDAAKRIKGRKRHILVDTNGFLLKVVSHSAAIQDRDGAKLVLEGCQKSFPRLQKIWAGGSYRGQLIEWVKKEQSCTLEIVKKPAEQKGFSVLPRRWVVEENLCLAWALSTIGQRLRSVATNDRNIHLSRNDSHYAKKTHKVGLFLNALRFHLFFKANRILC